jgi:hypothetical protein
MKQARPPELTALSKKLLEDSEKYFAEGGKQPECKEHEPLTVAEIKKKGLINVAEVKVKTEKRPRV